jgi:2-polyprenyl-3-methyl-5-hydroxy-6-metoxy-1,4-benzoquinol methylase
MTEQQAPDMDKTIEFLEELMGHMQGALASALVYLGDKLGLYKAMHGAGPLTADELAEKTGLHPRWILEWLRNQGASKIVEYRGDGRFELTPEQGMVLADEENSVFFTAGMFQGIPAMLGMLPSLAESFRTGLGHPYDAQGADGAHGVARGFAPWYRHMLMPMILPGLDGVVPKLEAGAKVADVGCGAGIALIEMAKAFPASDFHGYELSKEALAIADRNKADAGVANVTFHDVRGEQLPTDGTYDLVTTFDCLHDMTHPRDVVAAIRKAVKDDGTYLIADIKSKATYEENVEENPMAAAMYGFSVLSCMSSAMSEPDGEGLGTLGLHPELAERICRDAGFTSFAEKDFGNPVNIYYEVRP